MIEKPSKRPGRKLRRRARGPIFLIILRFNPRPARISMTISASSRTSSEIESNDSSIRFITPGPKAIPSDTRPIRPGRRTLSKSESTAIERITIREMLRIICSSRVKQNQTANLVEAISWWRFWRTVLQGKLHCLENYIVYALYCQ